MFETHITADGTEMLIAQMDDTHLINMILKLCRRIKNLRLILESKVSTDVLLSAIKTEFSLENAKQKAQWEIKKVDEKLKDYVVEAALRGLDITRELQVAYNRTEAIVDCFALSLEAGNDEPEF